MQIHIYIHIYTTIFVTLDRSACLCQLCQLSTTFMQSNVVWGVGYRLSNVVYVHICATFQCSMCSTKPFASQKALDQHARIKHNVISVINRTIPEIPVCPICSTNYHTRERLVAHLSETRVRSQVRRTNCRTEFLALGWPLLSPSQLASFSERRKADAKVMRKAGHTCTLAEAPAKRGAPAVLKSIAAVRKLPVWCRFRIRAKTSYDTIINKYKHNILDRETCARDLLPLASPVENRTLFDFGSGLDLEPTSAVIVSLARPPKGRRVMTKSVSEALEVSSISGHPQLAFV